MLANMRTKRTSEFKAKIALAAIRGDQTVTELASLYKIHPNQITTWKRHAQDQLVTTFDRKKSKSSKADEKLKEELYCQIGQLKVELRLAQKKIWQAVPPAGVESLQFVLPANSRIQSEFDFDATAGRGVHPASLSGCYQVN